jgi:hypothetical protein
MEQQWSVTMPSSEVMHKWKAGELHSGSEKGPVVKDRDQAVAIMMSEKREEAKHGGKYPEKKGYNKGGNVEPSTKFAAAQNVAESLANPTGRTKLAGGGTVKPASKPVTPSPRSGWKRWGQPGHSDT